MYKIIITIVIFFVSCTSQQAKQEQPQTGSTVVKFTQKYTWVNNDQSKPQKCDTTITVILSNRVTIESREDGTEYQEDVNATNNVEITADGKITAFTVYTSDSTGVTYFNSQAKNTTIMQ